MAGTLLRQHAPRLFLLPVKTILVPSLLTQILQTPDTFFFLPSLFVSVLCPFPSTLQDVGQIDEHIITWGHDSSWVGLILPSGL